MQPSGLSVAQPTHGMATAAPMTALALATPAPLDLHTTPTPTEKLELLKQGQFELLDGADFS